MNEQDYPVAKIWQVKTENGEVTYNVVTTEYVEIKPEQKYVGYVRFSNGWLPFIDVEKCDSHYVAFDCNYRIDELYEAEVSFIVQKRELREGIFVKDIELGQAYPDKVFLTSDQKGSNEVTGLFADKHEWQRIERVSDFISDTNNNLSSEAKENIQNKQWVLRFTETEYQKYMEMNVTVTDYSVVSEVTILRLNFKSFGKVYNLGVVDNKQTGTLSSNQNQEAVAIPWYVWVIGILIVIIALVILSILFPPFRRLLVAVVKGVWLVVSFPVRLIVKCVKALSERRRQTKSLGSSDKKPGTKKRKAKPKAGEAKSKQASK